MSEQEITISELAELVKTNTVSIGNLSTTVDNLSTTVDNLSTTVDNLSTTVDNLSTTVDELARMTKDGFDAIGKDVNQLKLDVEKGFEKNRERLERIELLHLTDHKKRIERLEDEVKELMAAR